MEANVSNPLCFECGLCCNGVIFARGQLQSADDPARLGALGLRLSARRDPEKGFPKFTQPCAAFDGCRCRIYTERPVHCREFDCLLLQNVKNRRVSAEAARRIIGTARRRADGVRRLLRELGDADEQLALSLRFQRMKRRLEAVLPDEQTADRFAKLTLAVHDLNLILSEAFYPG